MGMDLLANVPLAVSMALCLRFGVRPDPVNPARPPADIFGLASGGIALALIYAALDQGNRLDWTHSGLVWGLLLSGALLLIAFLVHELHTPHPGVDLRVALASPLPRLLLLIAFLRLTILSTSYAIPQFSSRWFGVFGHSRSGRTLVWIAVPQLFVCFAAGYLLRRPTRGWSLRSASSASAAPA